MARIIEQNVWNEDIYSLELDDPVVGGNPEFIGEEPVTGFANAATQQLANRTLYLKFETEEALALANAAIDAVVSGGWPVYATEEEGRSEVNDGDYFQVIGGGDVAVYVYRRDSSSSSTLVASYPSTQAVENLTTKVVDSILPEGPYDYREAIVDEYGNIVWGVRTSDGKIVQEDSRQGEEVGEFLLHPTLAMAQTDDYGNVVMGITRKGTLIADPDWKGVEIGEPLLHPTLIFAIVDENYNIIYGVNRDGTLVGLDSSTPAPPVDVYTKEENGRQKVKAFSNREVSIGNAFNNYAPVYATDRVTWIEDASSGAIKRYKQYPFSPIPSSVTALRIMVIFGQSVGNGFQAPPALTTPPAPTELFMFNGGVLSNYPSGTGEIIQDDLLQSIIPAFSATSESPAVSAGYERLKYVEEQVVVISTAFNGAPVQNVSRGTKPYDNTLHVMSQMIAIATSNNIPFFIDPILFYPGSANAGDSVETFQARELLLYEQLNEDIKAMTGQSEDILMILDQSHSGNTGLAQLPLSIDNPTKFRVAGARYMQPFRDSVHLQTEGNINHGAKGGRAASVEGWLPLYVISAVRSGVNVTLTLHNPSNTPLVIDTESVINYDDGNYGLRWLDSTNSVSISEVSVEGTSTINVTLTGTPTGENPMIGIADRSDGTGGGAGGRDKRSCIRDSDTETDILNQPMYNWLSIQRINVT